MCFAGILNFYRAHLGHDFKGGAIHRVGTAVAQRKYVNIKGSMFSVYAEKESSVREMYSR